MTEPTHWEKIYKTDPIVHPEPRPVVIRFTELLREHNLSSALDLGCGTGRHLVYMAKNGLHLTGTDNAPSGLSLTRQWLNEEGLRANLVLSDMRRSLPFASGFFDALVSTQVIHHALLSEVLGTAREIERVVRPGGMILVSVPARKAIMEDSPEQEIIEPNTFVPTSGSEKGLPHHLFTPEEFREAFPNFEVTNLQVFDERVIALQAIRK
jgi:SAM-dependent methyltransferase